MATLSLGRSRWDIPQQSRRGSKSRSYTSRARSLSVTLFPYLPREEIKSRSVQTRIRRRSLPHQRAMAICDSTVCLRGMLPLTTNKHQAHHHIQHCHYKIFFCHCLADHPESIDLAHRSNATYAMYFNRILALAAAIAASAPAFATFYENLGPSARAIPGKFIVKLENDVSQATFKEVESLFDDVDYAYNLTSFKGFAGRLSDTAFKSLETHPGVCPLAMCFH